MFEKENGVNEIQQSEKSTSGQSDISTLNSSCTSKENSNIVQNKDTSNLYTEFTEKDRENFQHWGATREIMDILRRRNNSPEKQRLIEQRSTLSRPGTPSIGRQLPSDNSRKRRRNRRNARRRSGNCRNRRRQGQKSADCRSQQTQYGWERSLILPN